MRMRDAHAALCALRQAEPRLSRQASHDDQHTQGHALESVSHAAEGELLLIPTVAPGIDHKVIIADIALAPAQV